jgi:hypothetical protein
MKKRKTQKKTLFRIVSSFVVMLILGVLIMGLAINDYQTWSHLNQHGLEADATIIDCCGRTRDWSAQYQFPYRDDKGNQLTIERSERIGMFLAFRLKNDDYVQVRYDPSDPSTSRICGNYIYHAAGILSLLAILAAIGIVRDAVVAQKMGVRAPAK